MSAARTPPHGRKLRVALVDDSDSMRALLRRLLQHKGDVDVVGEADDGDTAARTVADSEAELVIMDYEMARVDGLEATRRVLAARPSATVVAYTSAPHAEVGDLFRAAGAARHFDKADLQDLLAFVGALAAQLD